MVTGKSDQLASCLRLDVGGVDDGEQPGVQPLADDELQHLEGRLARRLVVLVVGHQPAAMVAGDDLVRAEVLAGEGGLARAAGADQADEGEPWDAEVGHVDLRKTAI